MARTISEFHSTTLFIEGSTFADPKRFHDEMAFKLGLPSWYGDNLDTLLDCLSSIGDPRDNLCRHWTWQAGKQLVFQVCEFAAGAADSSMALAFVQTIAFANKRREQGGSTNRIWVEFTSAMAKTSR
jgi:hypothetical protein